MDTTTADVGQRLDGRYRLDARVARGGMATVYSGFDERLDRIVAVKVMHPSLAEDAAFVERFRGEAKSAARLSHPNVVAIYDQGEDAGRVYLVMEHVSGRTLREYLREQGRLTPRESLTILEGILAALAAAHAAGIVHRDVKPENVLLSDAGPVKVADFGLARAVEATSHTLAGGSLIGTVAYLAPEQVVTGGADPRTDIYSAGVVLYEMLTGTPAFVGDTPLSVAYAHVNEDVPPPSAAVPGLPAMLDDLVLGATRRDPDERFADATTMLSAVRRARSALGSNDETAVLSLEDAPTVVTPITRPVPAPGGRRDAPSEPKPVRRKRSKKPLILAIVIGLILGIAGASGWWLGSGRYVDTPRLLELTEAAATAAAADAGLKVDVDDPVFSETVPRGQVVDQDPDPGDRIRRDGTVTFTISKGPDRVRVPDVRGKTLAEARQQLAAARLQGGEVTETYSDNVDEDLVIDITPDQGTVQKPGTRVAIVISKGRKPVTVPDVRGKSEADAKSALAAVGLDVEVLREFHETVPAGHVISQDIAGGRETFRGETVTITVSKGPETIPVPNVFGRKMSDARTILEAAGLKAEFFGPTGRDRRVFEQNPDAGTRVKRGSTVYCYVA